MPELAKLNSPELPWYYNVTQSVGWNCVNQCGDVRLVQYLLNKIFQHPNYRNQKPIANMVMDGIYGPVTLKHINAFQRRHAQVNPTLSVINDQRVDHARNTSGIGSISGHVCTITVLNVLFHKYFQADFDAPWADPSIPLPLIADMVKVQVDAGVLHE